jgi:uncharacterized protein YqjF (DUF2071 family)
MRKPFLTANWRYLAMLNFAVDPIILQPLVPVQTELDFHDGQTFISVVGFLFHDTRVMGLPIPFHRDFEEVNLRFYVRRKSGGEWRRGVVFVRELVPRRAIALIARTFYGEPYLALPMRHMLEHKEGRLFAEYQWRRARRWETLAMTATGEPQAAGEGSHEEFITEHYWGYTARRDVCSEYRVEHPRWRLWTAETTKFEADVATLYGPQFVKPLAAPAASGFIAEGSHIQVHHRNREPL